MTLPSVWPRLAAGYAKVPSGMGDGGLTCTDVSLACRSTRARTTSGVAMRAGAVWHGLATRPKLSTATLASSPAKGLMSEDQYVVDIAEGEASRFTLSPIVPVDIAVSLLAHRAVHPAKAAHARRVAEWMLGGPPARGTPAQYSASRALGLCRQTPAPRSLEAAAAYLRDLSLVDAEDVSMALVGRGLTSQPIPVHGLLRLIRLWGLPAADIEVRTVDGKTAVVGPSGRRVLAEVRRTLKANGGPLRLTKVLGFESDALPPIAFELVAARYVDGWLCPVTPLPPPVGIGRLIARLLRIAPQTVDDVLAAAENRQVLSDKFLRPSVAVMLEWLAAQPWCDVQGQILRVADGVIVAPNRLDDAVAAALSANPGAVTTAAELKAAILAAGYSSTGMRLLVGSSPVPRRVGKGRYELRRAYDVASDRHG